MLGDATSCSNAGNMPDCEIAERGVHLDAAQPTACQRNMALEKDPKKGYRDDGASHLKNFMNLPCFIRARI